MIKPHKFREALGLTQEETAMVLKIAISQLAMFETGKRDLPTAAILKLGTLYNYVQSKENEKPKDSALKAEAAKIAILLEEELLVNRHGQIQLERKISRLKNKYQKSVSALKLVECLETQFSKPDKGLNEIIRLKAVKAAEKNGLLVQIKWDLKLKALQQYQKILQKELIRYKIDSIE